MRGFFEHQYLSFKKKHVRNLIALAMVDGEFHDSEREMVYKMAKKYGLKESKVDKMIANAESYELHIPDSHDEKMDQLYDIMQIIYADGKVDDHEIEFCEDIVVRFGYDPDMVNWLIDLFAEAGVVTPQEWDEAKALAAKQFTV